MFLPLLGAMPVLWETSEQHLLVPRDINTLYSAGYRYGCLVPASRDSEAAAVNQFLADSGAAWLGGSLGHVYRRHRGQVLLES